MNDGVGLFDTGDNYLVQLEDLEFQSPYQNMPNEEDLAENCADTVFLIGNGIVENGWQPYKEHLLDVKTERFNQALANQVAGSPDLSLYLARHAYQQRSLRGVCIDKAFRDDPFDHVLPALQSFRRTTSQIQERFSNASQRQVTDRGLPYRLRPHSLAEFALKSGPYLVVTTNWDLCVFGDPFLSRNLIQLHGRCDQADSIILPTEFAIDDLAIWEILNRRPSAVPNEVENKLRSVLRRRNESIFLYEAFWMAQRWIRYAKRIVVYGLAFNAYDCELLSLMPAWPLTQNLQPKEVVIINPKRNHQRAIAAAFKSMDPRTNIRRLSKHPATFISKLICR